jgi:hypothetical protein
MDFRIHKLLKTASNIVLIFVFTSFRMSNQPKKIKLKINRTTFLEQFYVGRHMERKKKLFIKMSKYVKFRCFSHLYQSKEKEKSIKICVATLIFLNVQKTSP